MTPIADSSGPLCLLPKWLQPSARLHPVPDPAGQPSTGPLSNLWQRSLIEDAQWWRVSFADGGYSASGGEPSTPLFTKCRTRLYYEVRR